MHLTETYDMLSALHEPEDLLAGRYGPLSDEQHTFAQMILEGTFKARQWIGEWLKLDHRGITAEGLARHAHKINSGLTMMLGYASLMLTETGGSLTPDMAAAVNAIVSAGEQAHSAVQETFEVYSRSIPGD